MIISEVWYGVTKAEYEQLESVDEIWIKNLSQISSCGPIDLLYLEIKVWPIRYIIMKRRFNAVQILFSTTQGPKTRLLGQPRTKGLEQTVVN